MPYEHTQHGWPVRVAFGLAALVLLVMPAVQPPGHPAAPATLVAGAALAVILGLMWSRLTVRIDGDRLRWSFGIGWPRFSLPLAEVQSVEVTRTTFWQGWGIRVVRGGWLYNVAGLDAVRITRTSGRLVLLGTDEPRRLKAAIEQAQGRQGPGTRR
ncbi:MAG: hypothetical protein ACM3O5_10015 [Betaproteobacteria bacterium]